MLRFIYILAATIASAAGVSGNSIRAATTPMVESSFSMNSASASNDIPPFRQLQKIIGGEYTNSSEYPWFAFSQITIEQLNEDPVSYACGSSFIHSDIVISAAHCVVDFIRDYPRDTTSISVDIFIGVNRANRTYESRYKVSDIYWPRSYIRGIGLIAKDIVFYKIINSTSIPPVPWNTNPSIPLVGDIGTAIGYGRTTNDGLSSNTSLKADISVISNAECRDTFAIVDDESHVCAFTPGKSACFGDSGGPIITQSGVLFGLTSFGLFACDQGPSVFTRVSSYSDMIASVSTWDW